MPLCQAPLASHDCGVRPLHCLAPGTHTPPHTPALHTKGHALALCQAPVPSQVCGVRPLHCVAPGTHTPEQTAPEQT